MMKKQVVGAVVAGALALCAALPSQAMARGGWRRLAGSSAYDTMEAVVQADGVFTAESVDHVVIASGEGYWDALAASWYAGLKKAPVLITPSSHLAAQTRAEIERLRPTYATVVGGPNSVSETVLSEIEGMGVKVNRVSGATASDTAWALRETIAGWRNYKVIVASSTGYWDALAIAPYAYWAQVPVFLTDSNGRLSDRVVNFLHAGPGFPEVIISGGPQSVPTEVEDQLAGLKVTRLYGTNALETSAKVTQWAIGEGMSSSELFVASSNGYWDALTGAALAGKKGSPLVLASAEGGTDGYDAVLAHAGGTIPTGTVLGGEMSVSQRNFNYFDNDGVDDTVNYGSSAWCQQWEIDEGAASGWVVDLQASGDAHVIDKETGQEVWGTWQPSGNDATALFQGVSIDGVSLDSFGYRNDYERGAKYAHTSVDTGRIYPNALPQAGHASEDYWIASTIAVSGSRVPVIDGHPYLTAVSCDGSWLDLEGQAGIGPTSNSAELWENPELTGWQTWHLAITDNTIVEGFAITETKRYKGQEMANYLSPSASSGLNGLGLFVHVVDGTVAYAAVYS